MRIAALFVTMISSGCVQVTPAAVERALLAEPERFERALEQLADFQEAKAAKRDEALIRQAQLDLLRHHSRYAARLEDVVIVFSDYNCPACKAAFAKIPSITQEYDLQMVQIHLPIKGRRSYDQAMFALAQGDDPHISSRLYSGLIPDEQISEYLNGLSEENRQGLSARIATSVKLAKSLEISGTPAIIACGSMMRGWNEAILRKRIEECSRDKESSS